MIKKFLKSSALMVSAILVISGTVSATSGKSSISASMVNSGNVPIVSKAKGKGSTAKSPAYLIITDGNALKLKEGDIVTLKTAKSSPADLKRVKVKAVAKTTKNDIYDYLRANLPASKFQRPYTVFFSLTAGQIKAYEKIHKNIMNNDIKVLVVSRSGK